MAREISQELSIGAGVAGLAGLVFGYRQVRAAINNHGVSAYQKVSEACGAPLNQSQWSRLQETQAWRNARPLPRTFFERMSNLKGVALGAMLVPAGFDILFGGIARSSWIKKDLFSDSLIYTSMVGMGIAAVNVMYLGWLTWVVAPQLSPLAPLHYSHPLCQQARELVERDRPSAISTYAAELEGLPGDRLAHYAGAHLLIPGINPLGNLPALTFEVPSLAIPVRLPIPAY